MITQKRLANVSVCNLNQWAMDFEGNFNRIYKSCLIAKEKGSKIRLGPELEIPGYGCEDHFLEQDTLNHSWEVLANLLCSDATINLICSFSMPVNYNNTLYNCSIICLNKTIILIRPKMALAENGNYRESRYFTRWTNLEIVTYSLPINIQKINQQKSAPFGNAIIKTNDTSIGIEICEELWIPHSPNISLCLQGVEIIMNPSASHHELRKNKKRYHLIYEITSKQGGIYLYSNQIGCDGGRLYFDGQSMIMQNGILLNSASQFSFDEVEVINSIVDLDSVNNQRISNKSFGFQSSQNKIFIPTILVDFNITIQKINKPIKIPQNDQYFKIDTKIEFQIGMSAAFWLWDQLKRSKAAGFFLPLSGGADSAATATIIYILSFCLYEKIQKDSGILAELQRVIRDQNFLPKSAQEICQKLLFTSYMKSNNSSLETQMLAQNFANQIGSKHYDIDINPVIISLNDILMNIFQKKPNYRCLGGSIKEDITLQNMQARSRMVISYMMSQIIPEFEIKNDGFIMVLGSANLDECLRGYFTKYDCSSADLNPIGGISKNDLNLFLKWAALEYKLDTISTILQTPPTAELTPLLNGKISQNDENEMGMTYDELSTYGKLRKIERFGPVSMFQHLINKWDLDLKTIGLKVKRFFIYFAVNRHKMTVLTPSLYSDQYSCDDNRYDLRQFLYPTQWDHQFKIIDKYIQEFQ